MGIVYSCNQARQPNEEHDNSDGIQVLIFTRAEAYYHESLQNGPAAVKEFLEMSDMSATVTDDSSWFAADKLANFDVIVFLLTTGNVLDSVQQNVFRDFIRSGKGFVGIHSASDTEYNWTWYGGLVGAYFKDHPQIQQATIVKIDTAHQACKHLPERWMRTDEWYNFKTVPSLVNILLTVDESTYEGGTHGDNHPVSWCHTYDGGRSFYTAMGHTVESYSDTMFLKHILEGVKWAGKRL